MAATPTSPTPAAARPRCASEACIIRAVFLDRMMQAYDQDPGLQDQAYDQDPGLQDQVRSLFSAARHAGTGARRGPSSG
jgi:6-phosphogluconate dehydrogenase